MAKYNIDAPRLFIDQTFAPEQPLALEWGQMHYLVNVLRLKQGADVLVFNGRQGEWRAELMIQSRKSCSLKLLACLRAQPEHVDLQYLFAPLKHARLDYMVQKAVEMGASQLCPVRTDFTQAVRVNLERMQANVIEAAEQCGILSLPKVVGEQSLELLLLQWPINRGLIFCDEDAPQADSIKTLQQAAEQGYRSVGVLIGPEGGFSTRERERLMALEQVVRLDLGPRILRADTAAVAALALVQATFFKTI